MAIDDIRSLIDKIDKQIVKLLDRRVELTDKISEEKKKSGSSFFVPSREKEILKKVLRTAKRFPKESLSIIFKNIFQTCRNLEEPLKIAYLGPAGTYSHESALRIFGTLVNHIPFESIADVFNAVETGNAHYGVVPFENTTEGVVTHTIDLFWLSDLKIVGEYFLPVSNCLLSLENSISKIKKLYSHPQAFAQTRTWVSMNLPGVKLIETTSTAEAAKIVTKIKNSAAIASVAASKIYGLKIIAENIQDMETNVTRFLIIGKNNSNKVTGNDKTSILFTTKDRPGALYDVLTCFKKENVNMSKIESRPVKGRPWEYFFFVDLAGHIEDLKIKRSILKASEKAMDFKVLGSYPVEEDNKE